MHTLEGVKLYFEELGSAKLLHKLAAREKRSHENHIRR